VFGMMKRRTAVENTHTSVVFSCFMWTFHKQNHFYTVQTVYSNPYTNPIPLNLIVDISIYVGTFFNRPCIYKCSFTFTSFSM